MLYVKYVYVSLYNIKIIHKLQKYMYIFIFNTYVCYTPTHLEQTGTPIECEFQNDCLKNV